MAQPPAPAANSNILTKLDGQKPTSFYWQLTILAAGKAGLQVTEVGPEHIRLYDPSSDVRSRLPRYLIHKEVLREQPVAPLGAA